MKLQIRVLNVQYSGNLIDAARVRAFSLSWDCEGNISRQFTKNLPDDACKCCGKTTSIMIALDASDYVCQRCLFDVLAEELHE